MADYYDLQRFISAQEESYDFALNELRVGEKRGHWMWYIFPQIKGLGYSAMAERFAITSREEARSYAEHSGLGSRLRQCTRLVADVEGRSVEQIFGFIAHGTLAR